MRLYKINSWGSIESREYYKKGHYYISDNPFGGMKRIHEKIVDRYYYQDTIITTDINKGIEIFIAAKREEKKELEHQLSKINNLIELLDTQKRGY